MKKNRSKIVRAIVFYINVDTVPPKDVPKYISDFRATFGPREDEEHYFIPVRNQHTSIQLLWSK